MSLIDTYPDRYLPRDASEGALIVIDDVHDEIHLGNHYTTSVYASIGAASTLSVLITAPATGEIHLTGVLMADGSGVFTWSEAPNASGGSALVAYNNRRDSANAATLTATSDPTYVSSGTILLTTHVGTYAPSVNVGGQFANRQEWILAPSTLYLIRFTADGASCRTCIFAEWYEE